MVAAKTRFPANLLQKNAAARLPPFPGGLTLWRES
jgi:hypothetical protein